MNESAISVKDLSVTYGTFNVLKNVNFEIKHGEFIAIVGKSGTGKTTLLNSLAGFIRYSGMISVEGNIGFCFQNHSLFYWMTIYENIAFGLDNKNIAHKPDIVNSILQKIDLPGYGEKYPKELSGGQMQRVALGRAIANNPKILLLDEPFSSLDIYTRDQMMDWVLKIISELNITVVMVTHYLDEAIFLADRVFVLKEKSISDEIMISFAKPRDQSMRFTEQFQKSKQDMALLINHD